LLRTGKTWQNGVVNLKREEVSGRPSVVTAEIIQKIDENIRADRRLTIEELHQQCPEVSRTVLHETVTERLRYRKLCARWVPKMLTDDQKKNRVAAAQAFLARYEDQGDDFLDCIVTGDETWVSHHTPENKRQSV
jgi:histone-lysine N-methyltransferase SETMAR